MIGFECIWISIIMTLQIGTLIYLESFSGIADVGVNSGQHLCHIERTSRVLRDKGTYFGLRFDYHSRSHHLAGRDPVCVTIFSCPYALDPLVLIFCASSTRLLYSTIDVVYHTPAHVSCAMGYLDLHYRLVRRWWRSGQRQFGTSDTPARELWSYASIRLFPSTFDFLAPSRRGESTCS